jgi:hypothetical protein
MGNEGKTPYNLTKLSHVSSTRVSYPGCPWVTSRPSDALSLPGLPTAGSGSNGEEKLAPFPSPPAKCGLTKNLYIKSERLTASCRVTSAWSGRVNLCN